MKTKKREQAIKHKRAAKVARYSPDRDGLSYSKYAKRKRGEIPAGAPVKQVWCSGCYRKLPMHSDGCVMGQR